MVLQSPAESVESEVTLAKGVADLGSLQPSEVCAPMLSVPGHDLPTGHLIICIAKFLMQ